MEVVGPQLEPGEQVVVGIGQVQTGPTPWMFILTYLIIFWIKYWGIALTDRRLIFVRCSKLTGGLREVDHSIPRASVRVIEYKRPGVWGKLVLDVADGEAVRLNVHRIHRDDADGVVQLLGAPAVA